ncbi:MAG: hypothetical protein HY376_01875 [Candidatus Blackburnbacteria bacterium]|nr:hypothetical protein [Candidatus Blackburnbacteria bacterium]
MIRDIYNEIKWAYQRVVRGYDDRVMWGLGYYFEQVTPAIEKFCRENVADEEYIKINADRYVIFKKTLELLKEYQNMNLEDCYKHPNQESRFWSYIGENVGYFWD